MTKYDGGPAFPASVGVGPGGDVYWSWDNGGEGMSMRDWFAGQVLPNLMTYALAQGLSIEDTTGQAYLVADSMLKARQADDQ